MAACTRYSSHTHSIYTIKKPKSMSVVFRGNERLCSYRSLLMNFRDLPKNSKTASLRLQSFGHFLAESIQDPRMRLDLRTQTLIARNLNHTFHHNHITAILLLDPSVRPLHSSLHKIRPGSAVPSRSRHVDVVTGDGHAAARLVEGELAYAFALLVDYGAKAVCAS